LKFEERKKTKSQKSEFFSNNPDFFKVHVVGLGGQKL